MDLDGDTERERSEPCSVRANPFTGNEAFGSRKRQKILNDTSLDLSSNTMPDGASATERSSGSPSTAFGDTDSPGQPAHLPTGPRAEPKSSKVTINLRNTTSSEVQTNTQSAAATVHGTIEQAGSEGRDSDRRRSMESGSEDLSPVPAIATPSRSVSRSSSPRVELVNMIEDNHDLDSEDPRVAILEEDEDPDVIDPFPGARIGESPGQAVLRLARHFQYDEIDDPECFCRLRDWVAMVLDRTRDMIVFYDAYHNNREVWLKIPEIMNALSRRSRFFGAFLQRSREGRQAVSEMFAQFARLTGRFLLLDTASLEQRSGVSDDHRPNLISYLYLRAYSLLLRKEETSHIGRNLETHYNWNWDAEVVTMSECFKREGGTVRNLTSLVHGQLKCLESNPKIVEQITEPCRIVAKIITDIPARVKVADSQLSPGLAEQKALLADGYEFFKLLSAGLQVIIEKYITSISADAVFLHLTNLTAIYSRTLSNDTSETKDIIHTFQKDHPQIPLGSSIVKAISYTWKLNMLQKLITSAQMQLRVNGVSTMCSDLLQLYNVDKERIEPYENPLLLHFAQLLIRQQLINYIVGIGSHPEIINESNNIVGFLVVTRTYTQQDTDRIWHTVMTSQDPRLVAATLRLLCRLLHLYDLSQMLYLCQKIDEVPVGSFNLGMRDLSRQIVDWFVAKWADGSQCLQSAPYNIFVRLIKESSVSTDDGILAYPELNNFALEMMQVLVPYGPPTDSRSVIYKSCMNDIAVGSPMSLGGICLVNLLLRRNADDLLQLTNEHELTHLLIETLERAGSSNPSVTSRTEAFSGISTACLEILMLIISNHPTTITPELGERLWTVLVGNPQNTTSQRNNSWATLNNVMADSLANSQPNTFLIHCYQAYFPDLPAACFSIGALDFVKLMVEFWMSELRSTFDSKTQEPNFGALELEQLWRMILTAPSNTIEAATIKVLVKLYVDSDLIAALPVARIRTLHQQFAEQCLNQLKVAASTVSNRPGSSNSTTDTTSLGHDYFESQEKLFIRSLAVLKEFLKAHQANPQFAVPKPVAKKTTKSEERLGQPLDVYYQSFDGDKQTEIRKVTLGSLSTAASLLTNLQEATGFQNYKIYFGGKPYLPNEYDVCKSLEDLNLSGLVLVQRRDNVEDSSNNPSAVPVSLEHEIMEHIDELWDYLGMHDTVAQEIYHFLIKFPIYGRLLETLTSEGTVYTDVFPATQPFKSLYAAYVIQESTIGAQGREPQLSLVHAITLSVSALCDEGVLEHCGNEELKNCLATNLVDCIVKMLKHDELPPSAESVLSRGLFQRLLQLLIDAKAASDNLSSAQLMLRTFKAILEASLHSRDFWNSASLHLQESDLLEDLILNEPQSMIRKEVVKGIVEQCSNSRIATRISSSEIITTFWILSSGLISKAPSKPRQCEDMFFLSLALFREASIEPEELRDLVKDWSQLLVSYENKVDMFAERFDSPEVIDPIALGLANLLQAATLLAKASRQPLLSSKSGTDLFRERLFPALSDETVIEEKMVPRLPILHTATRERLAETVFLLAKDDDHEYKKLLQAVSSLVPYSVSDEEPYSFELPFGFDRSQSIRSPTGYVGLRNLSNTCYLNSLFAQLFMNIAFRNFMMNMPDVDDEKEQRLLLETQILFSNMQNSLARYVNPGNVASSIQTYDLTKIDVSVQMDVDEFYNLLFDRWEGQISNAKRKQKFKSFYGGQLVQQVKSKECEHISEREEPFLAIQCEIKGKTCLEESLRAYVEGEVMEGDNKYKCSTCDRHVDAVKRACLKDIPDNLIFHLKRFDFNLRTLQRSKINDYFAFPRTIDMRPYKVDYLMGKDNIPEDVFELVGVLVHSGTAESGHYYSYVRERPSTDGKQPWVEYNDEIVTSWDSSTMETCCFGGPDARPGNDTIYDKSYSAYMLFYQRSSTVADQQRTLAAHKLSSPVRLDIPGHLGSHIAMDNELTLRKYCLYEPSHTIFVSRMLGNARKLNGGLCSDNHEIEKFALRAALSHLDQVVSRTKDLPQFSGFLGAIGRICQTCAECSRDYLEYYIDCSGALRHLLLRNPDSLVRNEIANSILSALKKVKADAAYAYGLNDDSEPQEQPPRIIHRFVKSLEALYEFFHFTTRAWPEYFGLLMDIANLGREEATILLDNHFLQKMLSIVCTDPALTTDQQYLRMWNNVSKRMTTRPVSYEAVIGLLCRLLQTCDGSLDPISDHWDRLLDAMDGKPVPLSETEHDLLFQQWTRTDVNVLADKLLRLNQNDYATQAIVIWLVEWHRRQEGFPDLAVRNAVLHGLQRTSPAPALAPFLNAALIYCELSSERDSIVSIINEVAHAAYSAQHSEGKEFIQFFHAVTKLSTNKSGTSRDAIIQLVVRSAPIWGPALLTSYDAGVRENTENLVHNLILQRSDEGGIMQDDDARVPSEREVARHLADACLEYIEETYVQQRIAAVNANMLNIQVMIEALSAFYSDDEDDKESAAFHLRKERVLTALKRCLVDEIEEETSEWEASDEYPSSEPEYNDVDLGI